MDRAHLSVFIIQRKVVEYFFGILDFLIGDRSVLVISLLNTF